MILHDNNILSTFAKVDRLDLLFSVFSRSTLQLSANVEAELMLGVQSGYGELRRVINLISQPQPGMAFEVIKAGMAEQFRYSRIPFYPNNSRRHLKGEIDTIAIAWTRGATVVSNERKVYNFCRNNSYQPIVCLRLEDILRSLWRLGLMSKSEVQSLITEIESRDRVLVQRNEVF